LQGGNPCVSILCSPMVQQPSSPLFQAKMSWYLSRISQSCCCPCSPKSVSILIRSQISFHLIPNSKWLDDANFSVGLQSELPFCAWTVWSSIGIAESCSGLCCYNNNGTCTLCVDSCTDSMPFSASEHPLDPVGIIIPIHDLFCHDPVSLLLQH